MQNSPPYVFVYLGIDERILSQDRNSGAELEVKLSGETRLIFILALSFSDVFFSSATDKNRIAQDRELSSRFFTSDHGLWS